MRGIMAKHAIDNNFDDYGYYEEKGGHGWLIAFLFLAVIVAAYIGGMIYFKDHSMPNATINGQSVANKTLNELEQDFERDVRGWNGVVTGSGFTLQLTAADIDLACNAEEMASSVMNSADPMLWPIELTQDHDVSVERNVSFNENKLAELVVQEVNRISPQTQGTLNSDSFTYNKATEQYELSDESYATLYDSDAIIREAKAGIVNLESNIQLGEDVLLPNTEAQEVLDKVNTWLEAAPMELWLGGEQVSEVTKDGLVSLIYFDENGQPKLYYQGLEDWTRGPLSNQLDTYNIDHTYTRYDGKKIEVPAGSWGWMIDGTTLATQIYYQIAAGNNAAIEIPCLQEADWINYGGQDWGWSYMDIDLTEQHARLYGDKGVLLWESDIVSGTPDGVHDTPEGAYYFTSKETNIRLVGPLVEGTPEWDREVAIWYGVVEDAIGLHSAQWRYDDAYGGNIYTYNGSHGCINIPEYKARELWDLIEIGDPVIVHK